MHAPSLGKIPECDKVKSRQSLEKSSGACPRGDGRITTQFLVAQSSRLRVGRRLAARTVRLLDSRSETPLEPAGADACTT